MIWARYTDSELLWLFDTARKLLGHAKLISIQGLVHVGLHCNKLWSAGAAPGDQQHRAWPGARPGEGGLICVCRAKVRTVKHPTIVSGLVSYLHKLRAVSNQDQKHTPCQTIGPENSTLPRQNRDPCHAIGLKTTPFPDRNCGKHTLEGGTSPVHKV